MSREILIWGAGGHAKVLVDLLELTGEFKLSGFIDDVNPERPGCLFLDSPVHGGRDHLPPLLAEGHRSLAVAIGDNRSRLDAGRYGRALGFELPTLKHPSAILAGSASAGSGSVFIAGSVVNAAATIGELVIINTSATVDHDCTIEDACHVCPGAHLGGGVHLEEGVMVGTGASVLPGVRIGAYAVVGAGSVVTGDVSPGTTVVGLPARPRP
ncbi:acetyltransferase [Planctomycetota bacterium]|nr:acetyltransferase [Planctomycetota bacterium]